MTRTRSQFNTVKELNYCVKYGNFSLFLVAKIRKFQFISCYENTEISVYFLLQKYGNFSLFLVAKIFGNEQFPQSFRVFPQKFHTEKLGKILIFYVVNKGVALLQLTTS